jgi:hypothetical protein
LKNRPNKSVTGVHKCAYTIDANLVENLPRRSSKPLRCLCVSDRRVKTRLFSVFCSTDTALLNQCHQSAKCPRRRYINSQCLSCEKAGVFKPGLLIGGNHTLDQTQESLGEKLCSAKGYTLQVLKLGQRTAQNPASVGFCAVDARSENFRRAAKNTSAVI